VEHGFVLRKRDSEHHIHHGHPDKTDHPSPVFPPFGLGQLSEHPGELRVTTRQCTRETDHPLAMARNSIRRAALDSLSSDQAVCSTLDRHMNRYCQNARG
jgi:hypothetical protein